MPAYHRNLRRVEILLGVCLLLTAVAFLFRGFSLGLTKLALVLGVLFFLTRSIHNYKELALVNRAVNATKRDFDETLEKFRG